jgi:hypothetical protein
MNKKLFFLCLFPLAAFAQNVGLGTVNPLRARLEVQGVAGNGATNALFAAPGNAGISLQQNWPTIGFNQYRDITTPGSQGKYMTSGFASLLTFDNGSGRLAMQMFPQGIVFNFTPAGNTAFTILNNGNTGIRNGGSNDISLWLNKINTNTSAAVFSGTTHNTHFLYGNNQDTYIRAGMDTGTVIFSDVPNGKLSTGLNDMRGSGFNTNGSISYKVRRTTANYDTLKDDDHILYVDIQNTQSYNVKHVYLPQPTSQMAGRVYIIRMLNAPKIPANELTIGCMCVGRVKIFGYIFENYDEMPYINAPDYILPYTSPYNVHRQLLYTEHVNAFDSDYRVVVSGISYICTGTAWVPFDRQAQIDKE